MRGGSNGTLAAVFRAPFLVAVGVLGCAVIALNGSMLKGVGVRVKKELPLRAPLGTLDKGALAPFVYKGQQQMEPAIEAALGAKDYISWLLIDPAVKSKTDPLHYARLMVTYHSGGVDLVPHVPDQCYLGQGYQPVKKENIEIEVPSLGRKIPVRVLTFQQGEVFGDQRPTVIYLFHCNGQFVCTRNEVRYLINDIGEEFAYFSKIEITFGAPKCVPPNPSRAESIEATRRLLDRILPPLLESHFPDWEAIHASPDQAATAT